MDTETGGRDIRLVKVPELIHDKIERYMARVQFREHRKLTKADAAVELIDKATKDIKIKTSEQ
jgi:hypothetical protein